MAQPCGAQIFALQACAIGVACPEELEHANAALQSAVLDKCPSQSQALATCLGLDN